MKIRLRFLFFMLSTFLFLHSVLALSDDRYIIEIDERYNISDSLKLNVIEEIQSVKHLRQVAGVRIGLGKKIIVVSNTTIKDLEKEKSITYVEPDYKIYSLEEITPWNFEAIGFNFSKIDNEFGKNVRIAVLDTGADYNLLSIKSGYDFVNEDSDAFDDNGHGTLVSQILKLPNLNLPLPSSEIYAVKVLDENGEGFISNVIEGINWAMNNDIDIILMSFGGNNDSSFLKETINEAYNQGLLLAGAAGNDNEPIILFPAAYNNVVSVGSINENLERSSFSNYGDNLDFVAPGENIVVTDGNNQFIVQGTSFSVPHVGAVASAYLSDNQSLSNNDLREKLRENALDLGVEGKDDEFGWGLARYEYEEAMEVENKSGAWIKGLVYEIEETQTDDLRKPFQGATISFMFEDNETIDLVSDNEGKFELQFDKNITKIELSKNNCVLFIDSSLITPEKDNFIIILVYDKNKCSSYSSQAINAFAQLGLGTEYPNGILYFYQINSSKIPILLVHGWSNEASSQEESWGNLENELAMVQDYDLWRLQYWPANLSNRKNAGVINDAISTVLSYYSTSKLDVISYSMGSLGTRGYTQNLGLSQSGFVRYYNNDIRKYVIIAGPMYGSYFANLLDGTTKYNILHQHQPCLDIIKGILYGLPVLGHDLSGNSEATADMQIGSDFTWELNNKPINRNVDYLTISGRKLMNRSTRVWLNDQDYCLSDGWETNDGVVSLYSSNLVNQEYPSILVDRFHISLPLPFYEEIGIGDSRRVAKLASLFFKGQLNETSANTILNTLGNTGEFYYDPKISVAIPFELSSGGGIILDIKNSEISIDDNSLKLRPIFSANGYILDKNQITNRWFYTSLAHSPSNYILFTNQLPSQQYDIQVNGLNSGKFIFIKNGGFTLSEINLDNDNDNYDLSQVGGLDCNDNDPNIRPDAIELCNNVDDDCDWQMDEGIPNQESGINIGVCQKEIRRCINGNFEVIQERIDPTEEICDGLDNDCDSLTDEDYVATPTTCGIGACLSTGQLECQSGKEVDTCVPETPSPEVCDGIDSDCDGQVDEGACLNITVYAPTEEIYNDRRIQFNITTNIEVDEISYIDYNDTRPRWTRLCPNCDEYGNIRTKVKSFRDSEHNLSFRAEKDGIFVEKNVSFFIDSRDPRISKTEPRRGFADGNFSVEFTEDNPKTLTLTYGNSFENESFNLSNCYENRRKISCEEFVNLSKFEEEEIQYWFTLEDIADNSAQSKPVALEVDQTAPVINKLNYTIDRRRVRFNINITEKNFDAIKYIDNKDKNPSWRTLCSRLRDGICLARKSFVTGQHNLIINVTDKAGNYASREDILLPIS